MPLVGQRLLVLLQLPGTALILALVPTNAGKLLALLAFWTLTFRRIDRVEATFALIICVFYTIMNAMALKQGIFAFTRPDVLGMPVYELLMWGFYVLHTARLMGGPTAPMPSRTVWALAIAFAACFSIFKDPAWLLASTLALLAVTFALYHDRDDLRYAGYMLLLGTVIEYTGVHSGEWSYPTAPLGGVPPWYVSMWVGTGIFLRRLAWPIVEHFKQRRSGASPAGTVPQ